MKKVYISTLNQKNTESSNYLIENLFSGEEVYVLWYKPTGVTAVTSHGHIVDVKFSGREIDLTRERIGWVASPQSPTITLYPPDGHKKYIQLSDGDTYDTSGPLTITRDSGEVSKYFGISFEIHENTSLLPE